MIWEHGNPGSAQACKKGCRCPVSDNGHGRGIVGGYGGTEKEPAFWINASCPLHGTVFKDKHKGKPDEKG
jgi:hypothetical protein